jgi:hypothetical protein
LPYQTYLSLMVHKIATDKVSRELTYKAV